MKANFFVAPTPVSRSPGDGFAKAAGAQGRGGRGLKRVELTDGSHGSDGPDKLTTKLDTTTVDTTTLGRIESAREEEGSDDAMIQNDTDGTDGIVAGMDETGEVMM